jgi:hypothetical protein
VTFSSHDQHREQRNNNDDDEEEEAINQMQVPASTVINRQKNSLGNNR